MLLKTMVKMPRARFTLPRRASGEGTRHASLDPLSPQCRAECQKRDQRSSAEAFEDYRHRVRPFPFSLSQVLKMKVVREDSNPKCRGPLVRDLVIQGVVDGTSLRR